MKFFDAFGGIGGIRLGLERAGHECVGYCDYDKYAVKVYNNAFNEKHEPTDIRELNPKEMPHFDLFVGGYPCFTKDTLILTMKGYKYINEINIGDIVLTHKGNWKPVTNTMSRKVNKTLFIKAHGLHGITTTHNHPFYARKQGTKWNNDRRCDERSYSKPEWIKAKKLTKKHRLSTIIPETIEDNHDEHFWWVVGRYLADGWRVRRKNRPIGNGRVVIACGKQKIIETEKNLKRSFNFYKSEQRTAYKLHITNSKFYQFLEQFGKGASGKHIPGKYLSLTKSKAKALLEGYWSGDGSLSKWGYSSITVSKKLAYGLTLLFQKAFGRVASLSFRKTPDTCVIEGRTCNQKDYYVIRFPIRNRSGFVEGEFAWKLISHIEERKEEKVYNISVKDDESYTANNCVVHNCQSWSLAGKRKGFEDERGNLFFEVVRILREVKPKYFLLENVKGLLSHKNKDGSHSFDAMMVELSEIGYYVDFTILNSKFFGVPQNRERVFIYGVREDLVEAERVVKGEYVSGNQETLVGKQASEDVGVTVAKRFVESRERSYSELVKRFRVGSGRKVLSFRANNEKVVDKNEEEQGCGERICSTLSTRYANLGANGETYIIDAYNAKIIKGDVVTTLRTNNANGNIQIMQVNNPTHSGDRVYSSEGICPALRARARNDATASPKIIIQTDETLFVKRKRNEYGKKIRKEYESKLIKEKLSNMRDWTIIPQKISNTITTFSIDNLIIQKQSHITYRIRRLTPTETERLQGFPDGWTALGKNSKGERVEISNSQRYKQCGNAVTTNVLKAIGEELIES